MYILIVLLSGFVFLKSFLVGSLSIDIRRYCLFFRKQPSIWSTIYCGDILLVSTLQLQCPSCIDQDLKIVSQESLPRGLNSEPELLFRMDPSRNHPHRLMRTIAAVVLVLCLSTLPSPSVGSLLLTINGTEALKQRKMVVGSRPPVCANKCLSCRPCVATLVIIGQQEKLLGGAISGQEDDSYYLLSWRCRCGDKLFQP